MGRMDNLLYIETEKDVLDAWLWNRSMEKLKKALGKDKREIYWLGDFFQFIEELFRDNKSLSVKDFKIIINLYKNRNIWNQSINEYMKEYLRHYIKEDLKKRLWEEYISVLYEFINGLKISNNGFVGIWEKEYKFLVEKMWYPIIEEYLLFIDNNLRSLLENINKKIKKIGVRQDYIEFVNFLKVNNKINSKKELIVFMKEIDKNIRWFLKKQNILDNIDKVKFNIKITPKELENVIPFAEYRHKKIYKNLEENVWYITFDSQNWENYKESFIDTYIHEFIPGHAYFYFRMLDNEWFKEFTLGDTFIDNLIVEGWALYAEKLMDEVGYYDKYMSLAVDIYILLRIVRMKIDALLQTNKINFDQAVKMLMEYMGYDKKLAISEVTRYSLYPWLPSSYYMWFTLVRNMRKDFFRKKKRDFLFFHKDLFKFLSDLNKKKIKNVKEILSLWNEYTKI